MSKKAVFVWCIGLGLLDGIYCIICNQIPHVQHYMWIGFISLPIYFAGGAQLKEMPRYICCSVSGVLWGALTLVLMGMGLIANANVNMFVWVTIVVAICCFVHLGLLTEDKLGGWFCSGPAMFGGFAAIFSQGTGEIVGVAATLIMGIVLGWIMGAIGGPIAKAIDKPAETVE